MEEKKPLNIELSAEVAKGTYSNLSVITHSASEFIVDFISMLPAMPKALVTDRIIMAPENAKRLLLALSDNVAKYESKFGTIKTDDGAAPLSIPVGFNNSALES